MTLLSDLGGYLDTQSSSITLGTNFFYSTIPESPDNCVALIEDSGVSPVFTQGNSGLPVIERPQVQILVRHTSYETGRALIEDLYRILTQVANQSISGTTYLRVAAISTPTMIERDSNRRCVFTCNFDVQRLTP
jgi:hypothetical protein